MESRFNGNPNRNRKEMDDLCRANKTFYGLNDDGFCVDQSKVVKEKCFWCTQYLRGENKCIDVDDNRKNFLQTWLMELRINRHQK